MHIPVLSKPLLSKLSELSLAQHWKPSVFVDCTLGTAGHFSSIITAFPCIRQAVAFDRDTSALKLSKARIQQVPNVTFVQSFVGEKSRANDKNSTEVALVHANFSKLSKVLLKLNVTKPSVSSSVVDPGVDLILADFGVSSMQLDNADRGFSFKSNGPLDMRMDSSEEGKDALSLIERSSESELESILSFYGEEKKAKPLAAAIKKAAKEGKIKTTWDLSKLCSRIVGPNSKKEGGDPATRTFQALRMAVNQELQSIDTLLRQVPFLMKKNGKLAVISFHSLECKMVMSHFDSWQNGQEKLGKIITRKPLMADKEEIAENIRARSAKLRIFEFL